MKSTRTRHAAPQTRREARLSITLSVCSLLLVLSGFFLARAQAQQPDASDTIQSFPVEPNPEGLAFDGENIWATSVGSNNVTKLRASDGALLGIFPAGGPNTYIVFDGSNIWVTN